MTPENLLVTHAAPTLAGIKCSSLICLGRNAFSSDEMLHGLRRKGVGFRFFTNSYGCTLLFAYRPKSLKKALSSARVRTYLEKTGYDCRSLCSIFDTLSHRLAQEAFPHEIGFFLGYPEDDVFSFIEKGGKEYSEKGLWKIYHNVEECRKTCRKYSICTKRLLKTLEAGVSIDRLCVRCA